MTLEMDRREFLKKGGSVLGASRIIREGKDTFSKTDPTTVQKDYDEDYGSLEQEYEAMRYLNNKVPEYVPDIVDVEREDDQIVEIKYEYIEDPNLSELITGRERGYSLEKEDWDELGRVFEYLHQDRFAHGDLSRDNLMYGDDGWTIIDPMGVPENEKDFEKAKERDRRKLSSLKALCSRNRHV